MCGIAGFVTFRPGAEGELLNKARAMADCMSYRGPDAAGAWADPEAGFATGHRRLAIVDLSEAGAQPMLSQSGRYVISYNGEIYNAAEIRADLVAKGYSFRGHSDTEVLLEACADWGIEAAVQRMIGMFAFCLWDRTERTLWLVRDRLLRLEHVADLVGLRYWAHDHLSLPRSGVAATAWCRSCFIQCQGADS